MSKGVLMYAHNNEEIDYFRIACANSLMVRKNLNVPVTVVTDTDTLSASTSILGVKFINECFENVITVDADSTFINARNYKDSIQPIKSLQFYNCNHWAAYELSPYDETLFIDSDYLIMSPALSNCWGNHNEFMINSNILEPGHVKEPWYRRDDDLGIKQYWATVIYFKKTLFSKSVFDIVRHVQENYIYYKQLYYFKNNMFRNDLAFSVAIHMMSGFVDSSSYELPITGLLMSWDNEDIYKVNNVNDITMYSGNKNQLVRIKNQDIHIMNKWAVNRHVDELIRLYV